MKKAVSPALHDAVTAFLDEVKNVQTADELEEKAAQHIASIAPGSAYVHAVEQLIASAYLLGALHANDGAPGVSAADEADGIPRVSFSQAQTFLKSKVPLTKAEWEALEPKLRFRAFTVAVLGNADAIESVKHKLAETLTAGGGYAEFLKEIQHTLDTDALGVRAGYWETVFRTNTQSAYVAGKLEQAEKNGAKAYQLMVIDDGRTTHICRSLLRKSGYGMTLPADHPFWKTYGFPPYHFNCRTSVRPVYQSQLAKGAQNTVDNPGMERFRTFKVAQGFGGNPLDRDAMITRAQDFGLWAEILQQAHNLEMYSYQQELLKGYRRVYTAKNGYVETAKNWEYSEKEMQAAKLLADNGHTIYMLPRNTKAKCPDMLIDGQVGEIKQLNSPSKSAIDYEVRKAGKQRARVLFLELDPDTDISEAKNALSDRVRRTGLKKIYLLFNGKLIGLDRDAVIEQRW